MSVLLIGTLDIGRDAVAAEAGAEQALTGLPDYREVPAGEAPPLRRG